MKNKIRFGKSAVAMLCVGIPFILLSCGGREANLALRFNEEYAGKSVELVTFNDSTVVAATRISPDGNASFILSDGKETEFPVLAQFVVDGRVKGFYVIEQGRAEWCDTLAVAKGTLLNDRFNELLASLAPAEEKEDFGLLTELAEKQYNANKDNILGSYFGIEWLKWADPLKVDSLLAEAPVEFRESRRARRYIDYAKLRARTAPGQKYADFSGEDASGNEMKFSSLLNKEGLTLVDFMASWCPYCIKDMPELKRIAEAGDGGKVKLVSVAVRDEPEATKGAVEKHGISWDVLYNTEKRPYALYGFSGIPHYMLIAPDGTIVARSQSLSEIEEKL